MWPSVTASRAFGNVACPSGVKCDLPHCFFSHDVQKTALSRQSPALGAKTLDPEPEAKRVKLTVGKNAPIAHVSPSLPHSDAQANANVFVGPTVPKHNTPTDTDSRNTHTPPAATATATTATEREDPFGLPRSATRPVSPPPTGTAAKSANPDVAIPLMPRKLHKEPATFTKRHALLKALHSYLKTHNDKILKAVKPEIKALHLTSNQLIRLAVDEEERIAKESGSVYENILKQRLVKLKTMTSQEWVNERMARFAMIKERAAAATNPASKRVDTGLTPQQEILFVKTLNCARDGLDAYGYVTKLPTEEELTKTREGLEAAGFFEKCDRCSARFQVFPDRRVADGALTTGGRCSHHWGKRNYAKYRGTRVMCCNELVDSPGCTTTDSHVFNVKDPKRLSLIMPFIQTPENDHAPPGTAVCFDCEMGYTTNGLEMLRLTVISWPDHELLIDVLVQPLGHILDFNTRFSGITLEQFTNAKPYDPENPKPDPKALRIVDSPYVARDLFLALISPKTPVIGHALENDLNTIRLIHPTIIDTVILFPTRQGLPYRNGLRHLAKQHLDQDIQQGGAAGHDSLEDARTTGELVRFKIKEDWKRKRATHEITDEGVLPRELSLPPTAPIAPPKAPMDTPKAPVPASMKPAEKRKLLVEYEVSDEELSSHDQADDEHSDNKHLDDGPPAKKRHQY
ncbi:RNA exonuclease 3 [Neocucurbitaria cava]|uniref:RNA exonuclease 3 n=1 Tax=Neocucurbitaria cava TaxID=798079 RepID=A0A9W9CQF3_9PLEO|nr:RNA exonuclease 3 [Neocucurbitaria cava]